MAQHLTAHMAEPQLPASVVSALLEAVAEAYVRAGLTSADDATSTWFGRVPGSGRADRRALPYGKIVGVVPARDDARSTRSGYVGRHRVEVRHTAAYPDQALACYNACQEMVVGRPLAASGYRADVEDAGGGGGYGEDLSDSDETDDLYYFVQPFDLVIEPATYPL